VGVAIEGRSSLGYYKFYTFTATNRRSVFRIERGTYIAYYTGCDGLRGGKKFNTLNGGQYVVTLNCPPKNRQGGKIIIK
jgi:hypothetical protein